MHPQRLFSRSEVLASPCPVPAKAGLYAWFFREVPPGVPTAGCIEKDEKTLLYIGISPDKGSRLSSKENLMRRITYHYRGNAEGSTLRRTPWRPSAAPAR